MTGLHVYSTDPAPLLTSVLVLCMMAHAPLFSSLLDLADAAGGGVRGCEGWRIEGGLTGSDASILRFWAGSMSLKNPVYLPECHRTLIY